MKLWIVLSLIFSLPIIADERVVYGSDDRKDIYQVTNSEHLQWARSTAAMVDSNDISRVSGGYRLNRKTLQSSGVCSTEKFSQQITAASCTGFLVAPDLMVTAGHCMHYNSDCNYSYWVFDYAVNKAGDNGDKFIPEENVYKCAEIIDSVNGYDNDYSLFRLKKVVTNRTPLKFRKRGKVSSNTPLVIIGHPSGLPMKVADGAKVKKNTHGDYFVANLDSFGGNSGSPVFNARSGEVEGILVRGETDYVWETMNNGSHCKVVNKCSDSIGIFSKCDGEEVTRITNVEALYDL